MITSPPAAPPMARALSRPSMTATSLVSNHAPTRPTTPPAVPTPATPPIPTLLHAKHVPGPLSLLRLARLGAVTRLNDSSGYWNDHASTLYGRATIIAAIAPFGTVICSTTAAWIWLGTSSFPNTIDVISRSHFRTPSVGRRIRSFKRTTRNEHIIKLGDLPVTTPLRTACDLALSPKDSIDRSVITPLIRALMASYHFTIDACLEVIKEYQHHKYAAQARRLFLDLQADLARGSLVLQA